jgi:DNA-binding GntR family transcriptional regulator
MTLLSSTGKLRMNPAGLQDGLDALRPFSNPGARRTSMDVLEQLRALLLSGELKPGTILSQVEVARRLDVSRTPVREALRMLQQEGLVEGEPNLRCRVVGFTPELIDSAYGERILVETLAAAITTRTAEHADHAAVAASIDAMLDKQAHDDFNVWQIPHKAFHALVTQRAPTPLRQTLNDQIARTQRYRSLLKSRYPQGWWQRGEIEHQEIADAFTARNPESVVRALARHLARSALEIIADIAPEYEPVCVRQALVLVSSHAVAPPLKSS